MREAWFFLSSAQHFILCNDLSNNLDTILFENLDNRIICEVEKL